MSSTPPHVRMSSRERRAAILETAVRLFAERGFRGVTTRELAASVGVTEPVLYQHFATKRDLYNAIIEAKLREKHDLVCQADAGDDQAFFTSLGTTIVEWYIHDPSYVRLLLFSGLEGHELADLFHQHHAVRSHRDAVVSYIRKRIAEGAFRRVDPERAARAFTGAVGSYALGRVIFPGRQAEDPREMVRELVDIFLHGVASSGGASKSPRNGKRASRVSNKKDSSSK